MNDSRGASSVDLAIEHIDWFFHQNDFIIIGTLPATAVDGAFMVMIVQMDHLPLLLLLPFRGFKTEKRKGSYEII